MKRALFLIFVVLIGGCMGIRDTDPFHYEFSPIANASLNTPEVTLTKVIQLLEKDGYLVAPNTVFLTATTDQRDLGYQYWRVTNEKWKVAYQLGVQVIEAKGGTLYWKLSHRIVGSRSGKQDRMFEPNDFEITEKIVNEVIRKLMKLFSIST